MKKKKANYVIGDEIPIDDKTNEIILMYTEKCLSLESAMISISEAAHDARKKMFEVTHEKYPGLKEHHFVIAHKEKVIRISHKKLKP